MSDLKIRDPKLAAKVVVDALFAARTALETNLASVDLGTLYDNGPFLLALQAEMLARPWPPSSMLSVDDLGALSSLVMHWITLAGPGAFVPKEPTP